MSPLSMQAMFVERDDDHVVVVDGLLSIRLLDVGYPVTFRLELPPDPFFAEHIADVMARWANEGHILDVDLTRMRRRQPSVALSHGDTLVRLAVVHIDAGHVDA